MTEKREKVTVDNIIGLIHTDEPTNSVELKKDLYRNNKERFNVTEVKHTIGLYDNRKKMNIFDACIMLNNFHEQLEPIQKICEKYNINLKDLPATLEEYIANDNDGYAGYSKCDGCKYDFKVDEK